MGEPRPTVDWVDVSASKFVPNPRSSHEVVAQEKVAPLVVVRVGYAIGTKLVTPGKYYIRGI